MNDEEQPFYACEECGMRGPMSVFQGECRPGWTHGRLIKDGEPKAPDWKSIADDLAELARLHVPRQHQYLQGALVRYDEAVLIEKEEEVDNK